MSRDTQEADRHFLYSEGRDYVVDGFLRLPSYEIDTDRMVIHDVVWGDCVIQARTEYEGANEQEPSDDYDALLLELAQSPLFVRLQAVEQLTFSERFSTVPNTSRFSRWQHIWGSLVFARKMTENDPRFSPRDRIVAQLRTLFSDVGQTAFSHLGDWIFQGIQGGEDLHDKDLKALLAAFDVESLLGRYGLTIEETVFPDTEDWVECPSPDLCIDRLDYGLREILRWACPPIPLHYFSSALRDPKQLFMIDDQMRLIVKDRKFARYLAAGYGLLPADDWSHPTHRVQMELMQMAVKGALLEKSEDTGAHVRELLYLVDSDFDPYFAQWSGTWFGNLMQSVAYEQRRIFTIARKPDLEIIFAGIQADEWEFPVFPEPLTAHSWASRQFGDYPLPAQLSVERTEGVQQYMRAAERGLEIGLPRLKPRRVDPLVLVGDKTKRLSEVEPSYERFLTGQNQFMETSFKATIHMREDVAERAIVQCRAIDERWAEAIRQGRSSDMLRKTVGSAALALCLQPNRVFDRVSLAPRYRSQLNSLDDVTLF